MDMTMDKLVARDEYLLSALPDLNFKLSAFTIPG